MSPMEGINLAFWIGLGFTLLTGIAGIVIPWRAGARKTFVSVTKSVEAVLPSLKAAGLEVRNEATKTAVRSPHLLNITFRNNGPSDIGHEDFKGGALSCKIGKGKLVALLGDVPSVEVKSDEHRIWVEPMLFQVGDQVTINALFDGAPTLSVDVRLRNVKEGQTPARAIATSRVLLTITVVVSAALGLISALAAAQVGRDVATSQQAGQGQVAFTGGVGVDLRSLPSISSAKMQTLPEGTGVELVCAQKGESVTNSLGQTNSLWYRVVAGTHGSGWLPDAYLSLVSGLKVRSC